jgi:hypothetical protein
MKFNHTVSMKIGHSADEMMKTFIWCDDHVGEEEIKWLWYFSTDSVTFSFCDPETATLFALRWL